MLYILCSSLHLNSGSYRILCIALEIGIAHIHPAWSGSAHRIAHSCKTQTGIPNNLLMSYSRRNPPSLHNFYICSLSGRGSSQQSSSCRPKSSDILSILLCSTRIACIRFCRCMSQWGSPCRISGRSRPSRSCSPPGSSCYRSWFVCC